ncbi:DUF2540 domain-containing protein [Methanothermococcus okinawensis]|uniref:Uncharacterized protein n=1 Tax=Methanothermococcus okinawensis (strain DSM 14208 / JCM 11175 / IH1) TaxID=647113 RepID=F8ANT0_METOI|nr:DUF2540 domain-containing protein [Methanothermococcus okinawensis]AEH06280.1 hypothetical protein Metok_0290 [Methanothermococcus okinawensis IH1]
MDRRKHAKIFYLCKNIDSRKLRYLIHKLENTDTINLDISRLRKALESKKKYKRVITLSNEEKNIIEKHGKAVGLLINYQLVDGNEEY